MSIKTRRFLFYSLVIFFLVIGSFLVLNSRGYRIDWKTFQVEATGGIYVSSIPTKTEITLDGEGIKNQTGILQQGTLIDDLLPGKYNLSISLPGYSSWQKSVSVESGTVAVFDSIVLVPDIEATELTQETGNKIVAAGKHMAVESPSGVTLNGTQVFGHQIVALSESGTLITKSITTDNYYLANAFDPAENLNLTLTFNNLKGEKLGLVGAVDIKKVLPYPYTDRRFVIATNQALYLLDVEKLSIEQIVTEVNNFFLQGTNNIVWVKDNQIKSFSLPLRTETLALDLANLGVESSFVDLVHTSLGWLGITPGGELVLLEANQSSPLDFGVKQITLSPDGENVAILGHNGSVSVYNLIDREEIQIDVSGLVRDLAWFKDSVHLLLLRGDKLIFADMMGVGSNNEVVLAEGVQAFSYAKNSAVIFSNISGIWSRILIH